jgi:phosphate transport system protein
MTYIETELKQLKSEIVAMWHQISGQMKKAMKALATVDKALANDILMTEKDVNRRELEIDNRCENIFALYNPVAIDLRLVLALLKINSNLERIGDVAASVARYVKRASDDSYLKLIEDTHALSMFEEAADLIEDVLTAFEKEDTKLAESIFRRDKALNAMNKNAKASIIAYIRKNPDSVEQCLDILSIIRKLERAGDQSKNIAHEILFFVEAKVSKHRPKDERNEG